jgi:A/G-specific adenine glycosylase
VSEAAKLLSWYRANRRDLPWRRRSDAWSIWVSEVMLQQTRVEHVTAYFARFLDRFPTPAALASAPLDEALALWSGLGYYRRVRLLQRAAARVVEAGGDIPREVASLRRLPGVGDYTAAAVASIAFGVPVPVLDGNVARVLTRRLAQAGDWRRPALRERLRAAAAALVDAQAPGDSNQALMELGATVCTPVAPRCAACPLRAGCVAHERGEVDRYPSARARPASRRVPLVMLRVECDGRVLLLRRADDEELLAGTWELPWVEGGARGAAARLARRYGVRFALGEDLGSVRHAITTRRIVATVRRAALLNGGAVTVAEQREARWATRGEIATLPVSSLVRKALALG